MTSDKQSTTDATDETIGECLQPDQPGEVQGTSSDQPAPWRPLVYPYLLKLASKIKDKGRKEHSISFPIGRVDILISPLDQDLALSTSESCDPEEQHLLLIRDAIGMGILIVVAQRKYENPGGAEDPKNLDRVERGLNFGYRLSHAMTVEMRRLRNEDLMDAANEVQDSRRRLTLLINEAEEAVRSGKPERERPDQQRFVYQWDSSGAGSDTAHRPVTGPGGHTSTAPAPPRKGRKPLVLAVLIVVLGVVLAGLWQNRARQLPDFSTGDFPEVPGIEKVINRSPVILIIVSERQWAAADRFEKEQAVTSVRKVIEPAGYKQAEFRSANSPRLASWKGGNNIVIEK
ncbi:MAG: hypothetical protein KAJ78_03040 [Acidobacteria bacterium]|nr:hypothetical protein [Acidobacteriota bacterium]